MSTPIVGRSDSSIVYGFIWDGIYECGRFIPEFNLEEDWTVEGLYGDFSYPMVRYDYTDEEERTFEEGAHLMMVYGCMLHDIYR